jgi:twitching motility protein PilT
MTATHAPAETPLNVPSSIRQIIQDACDRGASAVYLQVGRPPFYHLGGKLLPQEHFSTLGNEQFHHYLKELLSPPQM